MKSISTVHGVKIYGLLDESYFDTIKEIEKVTLKKEWQGILGVYCVHNLDFEGYSPRGIYFAKYNNGVPFKNFSLDIMINYQTTTIKKLPIILIDTSRCVTKDSFKFTLLHELGHHVDATQSEAPLATGSKECEVMAHKFAISRCRLIDINFNLDNLPPTLYLKEAVEELNSY